MAVDPEAPVGTAPTEPAPAAPAEPGPGPWAADAAEYFGDNAEAIAAFDRYMREKQQPRITELETESAPARELYKDLMAAPEDTLTAVVEEIYGEDVAQKFAALFGEDGENAPAEVVEEIAATAAETDDIPAWAKPLLEREQRAREAEAREQGQNEYQQILAELRTAHPDLEDADMDLIHPFMHAANGDTDAAYAGYKAYTEQFKARHGVTPAEASEEKPEPPAVLGTTAGGAAAATPPVQKEYKNIDEAMDDWFAERRKGDPPPVI